MKDLQNSAMRMLMIKTEGHAMLQLSNSKKVHPHRRMHALHACANGDLMYDQLNWVMMMPVLYHMGHNTVQFMDNKKVQRKAWLAYSSWYGGFLCTTLLANLCSQEKDNTETHLTLKKAEYDADKILNFTVTYL